MSVRLFAKSGIWVAPLCLLGSNLLVAQTASLNGLIRDAQGTSVAGASVTLQCRPGERFGPVLKTTSSALGTYAFSGFTPRGCRLQASAPGLLGSLDLDLTHYARGKEMHVDDLILAPATTPPSTSGANSGASSGAPTFQASGIRGLIDPGGYSAPANAAAASDLLSGMANVRRADSPPALGPVAPCAAAPALLLAVREHPDSPEANTSLGDFYLAHGQASLAIRYLEIAHKASSTDSGIVLRLARAEIEQEQFAAARGTLAQLPAEPGDVEKHVLLAQASEGLGLFSDAAMQYGMAEEMVESVDSAFGQGYELVLAGRLPEAHDAFERGRKRFPQSVRLLVGRGTAEYLAGDSAAAVETFLQAVATDPADPEAYPFLAQAYLVSGEHGDPVRVAMSNYLAHEDQDGTAYYLQALVLSRKEPTGNPANDAEILSLLRKAIQLDPSLALAHFRLGILLARQGENEAAALQFEEALHLQSDLPEAHFRLSGVDRKLGRTEAAAREMATFRSMQVLGKAQNEDAGVDLRQFISVMRSSQPARAAEPCRAE